MRSVAFLAVLLSLFAFACASSPSSTHFDLAKRASCNTKSCLTTRYIAQNKSVKTLQRSFSQTVAAEKKATALLKRAVKGGKKNAHKVSVFKKRKAALVKKLKAAKSKLSAMKKQLAATQAALKKLASGSTPPATGSPSPSPFTSKKRGLSYNYSELTPAFTDIDSVAWTYNWDQLPLKGVDTAPEFVPMLWGPTHASTWSANAKQCIKSGSKYLLGFNEPDLAEQAHMTVDEAVDLWKKQMLPLASGDVKLVSPAVTGTLEGIAWLTEFVQKCPEETCKISAVAVHWYDRADNVAWFKLYLSKVKALGFPIWITEFLPSGSVEEQSAFFAEVLPWMEKQSWIHRYAAFGDYIGTLVDEDHSLSKLGKAYATA